MSEVALAVNIGLLGLLLARCVYLGHHKRYPVIVAQISLFFGLTLIIASAAVTWGYSSPYYREVAILEKALVAAAHFILMFSFLELLEGRRARRFVSFFSILAISGFVVLVTDVPVQEDVFYKAEFFFLIAAMTSLLLVYGFLMLMRPDANLGRNLSGCLFANTLMLSLSGLQLMAFWLAGGISYDAYATLVTVGYSCSLAVYTWAMWIVSEPSDSPAYAHYNQEIRRLLLARLWNR